MNLIEESDYVPAAKIPQFHKYISSYDQWSSWISSHENLKIIHMNLPAAIISN